MGKHAGYVRCAKSHRVRGWGHDESFEVGKVYAIEDENFYNRLLTLQRQSGRHMVNCFEEVDADEYAGAIAEEAEPGRPDWPLASAPAAYLERHGDEAKWAELAREVIVWDEAHAASDEDEDEDEKGSETE